MPPAEPGKPKSRQRQSAEEMMVQYRRQAAK